MTNKLSMKGTFPALVFVASAAVAALMCGIGSGLGYLPPFMATAAVLANAGANIRKTIVATLVVYLISIAVGSAAHALLPATASSTVLFCAVGYLLCVISKQQHPPALALLAVVFVRQPDIVDSLWLLGTALAVAVAAAVAHRVGLPVLPKRSPPSTETGS